ncbi:aspartate 1-decarboxylase [bacterium]|nr:aspartate 1-decarboxylase [bacterium]
MQRIILKSKIHNATITQADLEYEGSISIDEDFLIMTDIVEHERVQVVNLNNGERFETYVICAEKKSGIIGLNGPAARLGQKGDRVHILSYAVVDDNERMNFRQKTVFLDHNNTVTRRK